MKFLLQLAGIFFLCLLGQAIASFLPFAFPSSAVSMVLLFLLFLFRLVNPQIIEESSQFLLKEMSLFFIPAGVEILECLDQLQGVVFPLFVICVLSTVVTFIVTAGAVRGAMWLQRKLQK